MLLTSRGIALTLLSTRGWTNKAFVGVRSFFVNFGGGRRYLPSPIVVRNDLLQIDFYSAFTLYRL